MFWPKVFRKNNICLLQIKFSSSKKTLFSRINQATKHCLFTWLIRISSSFNDPLSHRLSHSHMPVDVFLTGLVFKCSCVAQTCQQNLAPLAVGLWASFKASLGHFITWQCHPRHLYQPKVASNHPLKALICSYAKYNPLLVMMIIGKALRFAKKNQAGSSGSISSSAPSSQNNGCFFCLFFLKGEHVNSVIGLCIPPPYGDEEWSNHNFLSSFTFQPKAPPTQLNNANGGLLDWLTSTSLWAYKLPPLDRS